MISNLSYIKFNSDFYWKIFIFFCFVSMTFFSTNEVFASSDPFGDSLCNVVKVLSGKTAKAIATTAIFVLGIGFISGKLQWQTVAIASVGIVTIFSASTLVKFLSGSTAGAVGCS
jgi:type IV secretory pathway VirB2 component (pilin)